MSADPTVTDTPTLSFHDFWSWLIAHPNCILRAGTSEAIIYDEDDLHWHFASEGAETMLVQLIRGKRLMAELLVRPDIVSYVQGYEGDHEEEFVFELITENEHERASAYFFVISHAYDDPGPPEPGRAVH